MIFELENHKKGYFVLGLGLLTFVFLFFAVWPNRVLQRLIISAMVVFYIVWGVLSHRKLGHLSKQIFHEYVSIGLLGGVMLWLLTI